VSAGPQLAREDGSSCALKVDTACGFIIISCRLAMAVAAAGWERCLKGELWLGRLQQDGRYRDGRWSTLTTSKDPAPLAGDRHGRRSFENSPSEARGRARDSCRQLQPPQQTPRIRCAGNEQKWPRIDCVDARQRADHVSHARPASSGKVCHDPLPSRPSLLSYTARAVCSHGLDSNPGDVLRWRRLACAACRVRSRGSPPPKGRADSGIHARGSVLD
jgi:hypothetical protein